MKTLVLLAMALMAVDVYASHYRGGTFYWEKLGKKEIRIYWHLAFRRGNDFLEYMCNNVGQEMTSEDVTLTCTNCNEDKIIATPLKINCTFFSREMEWSLFDGHIDYKADHEAFNMALKTDNCIASNWIELQNYGSGKCWSLLTKVDTSIENNSPRVTSGLPVYRVRQGCGKVAINLNPIDIDGDPTRCRWASHNECPERRSDIADTKPVCNQPTDFTKLYRKECKIEFDVGENEKQGWYAASVMIEDFEDETYSKAKSTVPFQFLLEIIAPGSCVVPKIEIDEECSVIVLGETWESSVKASLQDGSAASRINEIQASGIGLTMHVSPTSDKTSKQANIFFKPEAVGTYTFSFTATDNNGVQSAPKTARVIVSAQKEIRTPEILAKESTPAQKSMYEGTEEYWTIKFNTNVIRPKRKALIKIIENGTTNVIAKYNAVNETQVKFSESDPTIIQFPAPTGLEGGKVYLVSVDSGAAVKYFPAGPCGEGSPSVVNSGVAMYPFEIPKSEPEVECGDSYIKVLIPKTYVNNIPAGELHLHDKKCKIEDNGDDYQAKFGYDECGTRIVEPSSNSRTTTFYNTILDDPKPIFLGGSVTRAKHKVEVQITCEMSGASVSKVIFKPVRPPTGEKYAATGRLKTYLRMYEDSGYTNETSGPVSVNIKENMYFAAGSTSGKSVAIQSCIATNKCGTGDDQKYTFIQNGCGIDPSVRLSSSGLNHRFSIKSFEFMDQASDEIVVKCKIISCNKENDESRCATLKDDQYCSSKGRRRRGNRIGTFEDETNAFMTFKM